jgi:hypothetical protein
MPKILAARSRKAAEPNGSPCRPFKNRLTYSEGRGDLI